MVAPHSILRLNSVTMGLTRQLEGFNSKRRAYSEAKREWLYQITALELEWK